MKTPEQMAKEYVKQEQLEYDEAGGAYYGFLAGYKAAQDQVLARFKSLLSSFAETSFNPNHTAWQIFDTLNENQAAQDQLADADKVMPLPAPPEEEKLITSLDQIHRPQKRISVEELREMFPDKPPKEEK